MPTAAVGSRRSRALSKEQEKCTTKGFFLSRLWRRRRRNSGGSSTVALSLSIESCASTDVASSPAGALGSTTVDLSNNCAVDKNRTRVETMEPSEYQEGLPLEVNVASDQSLDNYDYDEEEEEEVAWQYGPTEATVEQQRVAEHYETAVSYAATHLYERSVKEVEEGLALLSADKSSYYYWELLVFKANMLARLGRFEESLRDYQQVLERRTNSSGDNSNATLSSQSAADRANLYYACGRLSVHLKRYEDAIKYHILELEVTCALVGKDNLAVSRIYHELARLSGKEGLCNAKQAVCYYQSALEVELACLKQARTQAAKTGCCPRAARKVQELSKQIQETKKSVGRVYFEMGDIDHALRLTIRT